MQGKLSKVRMLLRIIWLLWVARWMMWFEPFKKMAAHFGEEGAVSHSEEIQDQKLLKWLRHWIPKVANKLPWKCKCLSQAYTAARILQHYQIPYTAYFGVAKEKDKNLEAHAWLVANGITVTGGREKDDFKQIHTFGSSAY